MLPNAERTSFVPGMPIISVQGRCFLILIACIALGLLFLAGMLQPNPQGFGTHKQLGFNPCTMQELWNMRCPSCGMTTSWSHFMRGQILQSLQANSGGTALALGVIMVAPWMLLSGLLGKWFLVLPNEWAFAGIAILIMFLTIVDWMLHLWLKY